MSVTLTPEQRAAIGARGRVIVSASAGSGKTFVMIERLVELILAGEDVRRILAVTFTNKAAAQMRERLRNALLKGIAAHTGAERERLKDQLAALPLAEISTIHAFCGRLVRTYFYAAGVDPAFRIAGDEEAEGTELRARALDAAFEEMYADREGNAALLAVFCRRGKDAALRKTVKDLHKKVRMLADYEERLAGMGTADRFDEACACIADDCRLRLRLACADMEEAEGAVAALGDKMLSFVHELLARMHALAQEGDLYAMKARAEGFEKLRKRPSVSDPTADEKALIDLIGSTRSVFKGVCDTLDGLAAREEEEAACRAAAQICAALGRLVLAFDRAYAREKAEAGVLDYDDLEHFALRLLNDERVRADLADKYRAVFVDEYQDVNPVQEAILSRVCGEEIFLVGDAKQAIYGFRGSRSEYFEEKERSLPVSLRLTTNFRSAPAVLDAVDRVFARLLPGYVRMCKSERYKEYEGQVCFHLLPARKQEKAPPDKIYSVLEHTGVQRTDALGERVARLVEEELGKTWYDVDGERERRVTFGDIAVLTRRKEHEAQSVAAALAEHGIPVTTTAEVNVCEFFEAHLLLDWLTFLDDPEQDAPFVTALLSAAGGMTESELAQVRLAPEGKGNTFYRACAAFCTAHPSSPVAKKLAEFEKLAQELRVHTRVRTAAQVMNELLALGLEAQIAAKPGGSARLARVRRLIAEGEEVSVSALLARLRATGFRLNYSESGGEDAVKVITMHASKGLEYPVVILAGADVQFSYEHEKDDVLWTEKFLAAPKAYDMENKVSRTTLVRRASSLVSLAEERKQAKNLLYVGMTRAKYRLHIIFDERTNGARHPELAMRSAEFFDFDAFADLFVPDEGETPSAPPRRALVYEPDAALRDEVLRVYRAPYAFEGSTRLRVKSSATDLLRAQKGRLLPKTTAGMSFLDEDEPFDGETSIEAGIAYHIFLQHVRYGADAGEELERMLREGVLTQQQAAMLDVRALENILAIPCLAELGRKKVLREQTFLMRLPASQMTPGAPDDEVIFQGAIDLLVPGEGSCEVIDYKYSVLPDGALAQKYAVQISLYKKAAARVLGLEESAVRARIVNIARCREIVM